MEQELSNFSTELLNGLNVFCKTYFKECLHLRNGYNVIYIKDTKTVEFASYVSYNYEIGELADPALSKEESVSKIVYVVDTKKFRNYNKDEIEDMSYNMAFVLFGISNGLTLTREFKIPEDTKRFIGKSLS